MTLLVTIIYTAYNDVSLQHSDPSATVDEVEIHSF